MTTKMKVKVRFGLPEVTDRTHRKENVNDMTLAECMGGSDLTSFVELDELEDFKEALELLGSVVLEEEEVTV